MDSNHRRLRQLSYRQPHLATLVTALVLKNSLLFCGYKYRTFSIRCKILNTKIQRIICENSTYSPISLTTKLIFTYGVYIHVYPNCTLISVNMYITAYVFIPDRCVSGAFAERGGNNSRQRLLRRISLRPTGTP